MNEETLKKFILAKIKHLEEVQENTTDYFDRGKVMIKIVTLRQLLEDIEAFKTAYGVQDD